jgi:hypothetical protein
MAHLCAATNEPLRQALDVPDGFIISRHRDRIERVVRSTHPHTVVFRELNDESTCVLHVFGLFRERTYREIALSFNRQVLGKSAAKNSLCADWS